MEKERDLQNIFETLWELKFVCLLILWSCMQILILWQNKISIPLPLRLSIFHRILFFLFSLGCKYLTISASFSSFSNYISSIPQSPTVFSIKEGLIVTLSN